MWAPTDLGEQRDEGGLGGGVRAVSSCKTGWPPPAHEHIIRSGCSPAIHDRATEVVATGSACQATRERRLP
jgi:hypothetical protein